MISSLMNGYATLCLLACTLLGYAQQRADQAFFEFFDQTVGVENTDLYQGVLHQVTFRSDTDKTPFFKNKNFIKGKVLYGGQWYHDLDLKYDVEGDRVFLKLIPKAGGGTLVLFNDRLAKFEIGGSHFINIRAKERPEMGLSGFCEISLASKTFTLYTKYHKKRIRRKERKALYYEFVDQANTYALYYREKYHPLNSKREVKKLFPRLKKEIEKFYGLAKRLRKSDPEGFQIALLKRIEVVLLQAEKTE